MGQEFNPKILGFMCNWCCYAAADSAGVGRYQYPPNVRTIRMMCTGRMDPLFIIDAFSVGTDGVFVGGCHLGECHYQVGNYDAMIMEEFVRKILAKIGIDSDRFSLKWASAAEGPRFVKLITDFTAKIKSFGSLGETDDISKDELQIKLLAARSALEKAKLRTQLGNLTKGFRKEGDYSDLSIKNKVNEKLTKSIGAEIDRNEILLRLQKQGPITFDELTKKIGVSGTEIEKYVAAFRKKGLVVEAEGQLSATSNH